MSKSDYSNVAIIVIAVTIVGYDESVYTLVEEDGYLEICVVITRNGSRTPFVININTTNGTAGKM